MTPAGASAIEITVTVYIRRINLSQIMASYG
jgi:hypothetical protein